MQIKTTVKYHVTPGSQKITKQNNTKTKNITMLARMQGCGDTETLVHCCQECETVQTPFKMVWRLVKKLKIHHDMTLAT